MASDPYFEQTHRSTTTSAALEESLNDKAERCRRLAAGISDRQAAEVLRSMALQYEDSAARQSV